MIVGSGEAARRGGFSLVEVLVALLVLELGLLGVAGLVLFSGRLLVRAERAERALYAAGDVADSLSVFGASGEGERSVPGGRIRWRVTDERDGLPLVQIRATDPEGRTVLVLRGLLRANDDPGDEGGG